MTKVQGIIYCITNRVNGKVYIGQTTRSLEARMKEYTSLERRRNPGRPIISAMLKYGVENFQVEQIDTAKTKAE